MLYWSGSWPPPPGTVFTTGLSLTGNPIVPGGSGPASYIMGTDGQAHWIPDPTIGADIAGAWPYNMEWQITPQQWSTLTRGVDAGPGTTLSGDIVPNTAPYSGTGPYQPPGSQPLLPTAVSASDQQDLQNEYQRGYNAVKSFGTLNPVAPPGLTANESQAYACGVWDADNNAAYRYIQISATTPLWDSNGPTIQPDPLSSMLPLLLLSGGLGGGGSKKRKRKVKYVQAPAPQPYSGQGDYNPQATAPPPPSNNAPQGQ